MKLTKFLIPVMMLAVMFITSQSYSQQSKFTPEQMATKKTEKSQKEKISFIIHIHTVVQPESSFKIGGFLFYTRLHSITTPACATPPKNRRGAFDFHPLLF